VLGGYVDRSKNFKSVTLGCFAATLASLAFLGIGEGYDLDLPKWAVVAGLLTLGGAAGPIQPINAELAVEVSYPSDENAVEATQQLCGNLFSALLVPVCVAAAKADFPILDGVGPDVDVRVSFSRLSRALACLVPRLSRGCQGLFLSLVSCPLPTHCRSH
jgi:hypothetical protein